MIGSGRDKAHEGLCPSGHAGDRGPGLKGLGPGGSVLGGGAVIAAEMEEIVDLIVGGEEALGLTQGSRMKVCDPMLGANFEEAVAPGPC